VSVTNAFRPLLTTSSNVNKSSSECITMQMRERRPTTLSKASRLMDNILCQLSGLLFDTVWAMSSAFLQNGIRKQGSYYCPAALQIIQRGASVSLIGNKAIEGDCTEHVNNRKKCRASAHRKLLIMRATGSDQQVFFMGLWPRVSDLRLLSLSPYAQILPPYSSMCRYESLRHQITLPPLICI